MKKSIMNSSILKKYYPEITLLVLIAFLNLVIGCTYYRASTRPISEIRSLASKQAKYVIIHQGEDAWHMRSIVIDQDKNEIRGEFETVSHEHDSYKTTKPGKTNHYDSYAYNPVNEVHIYTTDHIETEGSNLVIIPLTSVTKIETYDKDMNTTILGCLGGVVGAMVIFLVIVALTKSSCPFVYTYDGGNYHFTGEMYGGAIYSSLERDDYMPLPGFKAINGEYKLRIANELLEKQYTDLAELDVVEHPVNTKVLMDKHGQVQLISDPRSPLSALSDLGTDYRNVLLAKDSSQFLFNDEKPESHELNAITLSFQKPAGVSSGKLILNAKNSLWLDYIYGKFTQMFGIAYNRFASKQKNVPAEKNIQWSIDQGLMLSVYLETPDGWKFVDYFHMIGPLANRDMVMPIDLSSVQSGNVRVKLVCGMMFWELDYAAMDFTENIPLKISRLSPSSALDEEGKDVRKKLTTSDKNYLYQPEVGNAVTITYPALPAEGNHTLTTFLHSRGYYEYIRNYETKPDIAFLKTFYNKGAFNDYSQNEYFRIINDNELFVRIKTGNHNN